MSGFPPAPAMHWSIPATAIAGMSANSREQVKLVNP